jgi:hypothetical protein
MLLKRLRVSTKVYRYIWMYTLKCSSAPSAWKWKVSWGGPRFHLPLCHISEKKLKKFWPKLAFWIHTLRYRIHTIFDLITFREAKIEHYPFSHKIIILKTNIYLVFNSEDRGSMFQWNICKLIPDYTALHPTWYHSSNISKLHKIGINILETTMENIALSVK